MERERKRNLSPTCSRIPGWGPGQGPTGQAGWSPEVLATLCHLPSSFVMIRVQEPSGWGDGQMQWAERRVKGPALGHQHASSRDPFTVKPTAKRPWKNHRSVSKSWSKCSHHVRHPRLSRWEDRPLGSGAPRLRLRAGSALSQCGPSPSLRGPSPYLRGSSPLSMAPPILSVAPPLPPRLLPLCSAQAAQSSETQRSLDGLEQCDVNLTRWVNNGGCWGIHCRTDCSVTS